MRRVGESISASAATVIVALLTLLAASFNLYHDLGLPLALGVAVMLLAGLTLLPALLAILGRAVFWPSKTMPREAAEGTWGRIASRLVRRPVRTITVGVVVLGVFALFALNFKPSGFGGDLAAPAGSEAAKGNAALAKYFPQSNANPTNVVMHFPTSVWQDPEQLQDAANSLRGSGVFSAITGPLDPNGAPLTPAELASPLSAATRLRVRTGTGHDGAGSARGFRRVAGRLRHVSDNSSLHQCGRAHRPVGDRPHGRQPWCKPCDQCGAADPIRGVSAAAAKAGADASGVAGEAAALYDVSHISDSDIGKIVPIAIIAIGLVLALVLRSLIAPIYLILSVVLSYLASLGISVLVFQLIGAQGGVIFLLPFLMFIFLLALGEDYNILVMTRIREEAGRMPLRQAVIKAVGVTGPTVTSAGLVLAGSFVVLAVVGGSGAGNGSIRRNRSRIWPSGS